MDGKEYNFVTKEKFFDLMAENKFVEFCENNGAYYGISKDAINKIKSAGKIPFVIFAKEGLNYLKD